MTKELESHIARLIELLENESWSFSSSIKFNAFTASVGIMISSSASGFFLALR